MIEIPLTQGRVALVDDADAMSLLARRPWRAIHKGGKWYAARGQSPVIYMHREILPVGLGLTVDHINGDGLDNQRLNLRPATQQQQTWNRAPARHKRFKGVHWQRDHQRRGGGRWVCTITPEGRPIVRCAKTEEHAARLYNALAREHFGEFAWLNPLPVEVE